MLTIDCSEIEPIKHELLIYVSDQVAAVPTLKIHEFTLSPIEDQNAVDKNEVIVAIKEFLDSIGESRNFAVISSSNLILIKSVTGKTIERETKPVAKMYSCAHCGFVTQYEVEHNNHQKIHYM
ncbi:MAG TPA: C2H2-type zinc finger protein [Nitrosopumilaceae archaeon]|nr:C2H2-type zinc finger protein [Nitrosopumilaceae archaeon]